MYLEKFRISKFRSIDEMVICFNKGVNIIIGENNSGKTAVIDALRICLSYGKQWKDIGIRNEEDFYIDTRVIQDNPDPIEFDLHFAIENEVDRQLCTSLIWQDPADNTKQELQMHFRYTLELQQNGGKKMRWSSWGGGIEGQAIDPNEAQLLFYTYLAPLRNAEQELRPYGKDNKITSLFRDLTSYNVTNALGVISTKPLNDLAKESLASKLEAVVQDEDWTGLVDTGTKHINEHLEKADIRTKQSRIHLRLLEYRYENVIKGLITRKPVYDAALLIGANANKQRYFDVSQNGLGENNLIYASAVLGDLKNRLNEKKEHYYSLLIEEPEAHLHPQRQNTFFNYLNNLRDLGLQVFITSHSPTITAKSDLDNLIIIQKQLGRTHPFTIAKSPLSKENKAYLRKFLDVTKSQLFFSNGTILVEGISETLLLPVFAKMMGVEFDLDQNGVEIVNIGGTAFEPFARLYNDANPETRLPSRCSLLTDDDRGMLAANHLKDEHKGITLDIAKLVFHQLKSIDVIDSSNRIITEAGHALDLGAHQLHNAHVETVLDAKRDQPSSRSTTAIALQAGNLRTSPANYTFEYELMIAGEINYRLMIFLYKKMHPLTTFLPVAAPIKSRALDFVAKLDANKDKSAFAQSLATALDGRVGKAGAFFVPQYIQSAIQWVIQGF